MTFLNINNVLSYCKIYCSKNNSISSGACLIKTSKNFTVENSVQFVEQLLCTAVPN